MEKQGLKDEIKLLISKLGDSEGDCTKEEYKSALSALDRETKILDEITKIESEESKTNLENKRYENDLKFKNKQQKLESRKIKQEEARLEFEKNRFETEIDMKKKELVLKERSDRRNLLISLASIGIPVIVGAVTNVFAIITYKRMGKLWMNMEYCDNLIVPRGYNEASSNIQKMITKK